MRKIFIADAGFTRVGDHWEKNLGDLGFETSRRLLELGFKIDSIVVANMLSGHTSRQEQMGAYIADSLGLQVPAFKVEAGGASGGVAVHNAYSRILSGIADCVLVVGVEKMRDIGPKEVITAISMAESSEYTLFHGASDVAMQALLARFYMEKYNVKRDELSSIPVVCHRNAASAEHAQFRKAISVEDVAKSPVVADPLRMLDCSPVGDGAAAVLLVSDRIIEQKDRPWVEIASSVVGTQRLNVYERDDMLDFSASALSAKEALRRAGEELNDLSFVELHDSYSITAALTLESIGLSNRGMAPRDAWEGKYGRGGDYPINTFGGLKGRGNPIGATGVYQIVEGYLQLSNRAGPNQVPGARLGLIQSQGGVDATSAVHLLRRVE